MNGLNDIRCPQCGSRYKSDKGDHYKCSNCKTLFYVDQTGASIQIADRPQVSEQKPMPSPVYNSSPQNNRGHATPPPPGYGVYRKRHKKGNFKFLYWLVPVLMVLIIGGMFGLIKFVQHIDKQNKKSIYDDDLYDFDYVNNVEFTFPFVNNNKIYVFSSGRRFFMGDGMAAELDDGRNGYYYSIYDHSLKNQISSGIIDVNYSVMGVPQFRRFSNGKQYIIFDGTKVYEINKSNFMLDDLTHDLFHNNPQIDLRSGMASVEFIYEARFEGFKITNNNGKEFNYNPWIEGSYPENEKDYLSALGVRKDTIYYAFSPESSVRDGDFFGAEPVKLLKIKAIYQGKSLPDPQWHFQQSTNKMELFRSVDNVKSYKDITPQINYLNPSIVYYDEKHLLIKVDKTASPTSDKLLKSIDVKTFKELWTINIGNSNRTEYFYNIERTAFADGYYLVQMELNQYKIISEDGENVTDCTIPINSKD